MIPRILHQIWIGPYEIPDTEKEYVNTLQSINKTFKHILWTNDNLPKLPAKLQRIYNTLGDKGDYAFQADTLRLFLIHEYGGVYLDVDFKPIGTFDDAPFLMGDGVFFYHQSWTPNSSPDLTSPNGIFGAVEKSDITAFMIDSIDEHNSWTGPSWMGETIRGYFGLPNTTPHDLLEIKLQEKNFSYYSFQLLEQHYVVHRALASWIPEHQTHFKSGNINFQKGKK